MSTLCFNHFWLKIIMHYFIWKCETVWLINIDNKIVFNRLAPAQIFYNTIYWKFTWNKFVHTCKLRHTWNVYLKPNLLERMADVDWLTLKAVAYSTKNGYWWLAHLDKQSIVFISVCKVIHKHLVYVILFHKCYIIFQPGLSDDTILINSLMTIQKVPWFSLTTLFFQVFPDSPGWWEPWKYVMKYSIPFYLFFLCLWQSLDCPGKNNSCTHDTWCILFFMV